MITFGEDPNNNNSNTQNDESKNVTYQGNCIFFYSQINRTTSFKFITNIDEIVKGLISKYGLNPPPIKIYVNSPGGILSDAVAIHNSILEAKKLVPIETYVDGISASAATFSTIIGHNRYMYKRSIMVIHQLTSGCVGKWEEIKDFYFNMSTQMEIIKDIYLEYTNFPFDELEKILQHDLYLTSSKCLEYGLIDEII